MQKKERITLDSPATYQLRIQGQLDERWSEYLGGVTIRTEISPNDSPVTVVTGKFRDQSALAGALALLYDLGLPLLSVECVDAPQRNQVAKSVNSLSTALAQPPE